MSRERLFDLDRAKGLGIFLVVLGHIVARENPVGVEWYPILKDRIYLFHMPFFMFVSGAIAGYAWKNINTWSEYGVFVKKRAERLLPAYFLFALLVFVGKLAAQSVTPHVDNPVKSVWSFFDVVLMPYQSFSGYLWFVFVLFLLYAALPGLLFLSRQKAMLLLLGAGVIQFLPATPYFGIYSFREYLFVFFLGFFLMKPQQNGQKAYDIFVGHLDKWWGVWFALFLFGLIFTYQTPWADTHWFGFWGMNVLSQFSGFNPDKVVFGLLSIPALLGFVRSPFCRNSNLLLILGGYTFSIYLMNTMAIGFVKAVLFKIAPWDGYNFFWYAPLLLLAGVVIPIVAKKYVITRIAYLDKITN